MHAVVKLGRPTKQDEYKEEEKDKKLKKCLLFSLLYLHACAYAEKCKILFFGLVWFLACNLPYLSHLFSLFFCYTLVSTLLPKPRKSFCLRVHLFVFQVFTLFSAVSLFILHSTRAYSIYTCIDSLFFFIPEPFHIFVPVPLSLSHCLLCHCVCIKITWKTDSLHHLLLPKIHNKIECEFLLHLISFTFTPTINYNFVLYAYIIKRLYNICTYV